MTNDEMWQAIVENDHAYDGAFFYAVKSTGIFCRPSCKSKTPLRENVAFFDTAQQALQAGYRPCKRCRPDLLDYQPILEIAEKIKTAIDRYYAERTLLSEEMAAIGVTHQRMVEIFRAQFGQTPSEYADRLRIQEAQTQLTAGNASILEVSLAMGFDSESAFYAFFHKHTRMTPGDYRRALQPGVAHANRGRYDTDFGRILVVSDGEGITSVQFAVEISDSISTPNHLTDKTAIELSEYFAGQRETFDVPLHMTGTAFQKTVWNALCSIPYGQTRSYKQVASLIGNPNAGRAVGMANNKNPLLILVPCHRVIGADGSPVGYAAGLDMKKRLLALERKQI